MEENKNALSADNTPKNALPTVATQFQIRSIGIKGIRLYREYAYTAKILNWVAILV